MLVQTDAILTELERILSSKGFSSSPRLGRFLRYCVEHSLDGRFEELKESMVGVNVFDRPPGYDPKVDPIVRVHAGRLREKLAIFYDSEGSPEIVIQIPKGGYVACFEESPSRPRRTQPLAIVTQESIGTLARIDRNSGRVRTLALAVACTLVVALLASIATRRKVTQFGMDPLVSLPGSSNDPAWAPDGKTIAFTWDGGASRTSKVYLLKNGESVPAELTAAGLPEYRPVWSPDQKYIALLRESQAHHFAIVIVDTANKTERVVRSIFQFSPALIPPALDWSSNGEWLVTSEQPSEGPDPVHLMLVSPTDGRSWVITDPPNGSTGDLEARFSPDDKRILFRRGGHGELFMLSLNGTAATSPKQMTFQNGGVRGVSWSRDGKTIYFGSQRGQSHFGIWRLRDGEQTPTRITPRNVTAVTPAIDPGGRSLAFSQPSVDVNLWLYDLRHPAEPRLVVPSVQAEYSPEFSPDGRNLAFISDRSGTADIWISGLNGGQPRKVTSLPDGDLPMSPSWSPDGTKIAFFCRRNGLNYAYQTDIATGSTRQLRAGDEYALFPQYSGDGKSFYYVSNAGNRFRIWHEPLAPGAAPEPVDAEEARFFRISKDRRYLYFLRYKHPEQLVQINLVSKEEKTLWTFPELLGAFDAWDVAGNRLFYINFDPGTFLSHLVVVDLSTGERRPLGAIRSLSREWQTSIAASPDGQSAIITQADSDDTKLMLMRFN